MSTATAGATGSTEVSADDVFGSGCMGVPEAVVFTGLGRSELYEMMSRGELVFTKIGRRRLVPKKALIEMLRQGLVGMGTAGSK